MYYFATFTGRKLWLYQTPLLKTSFAQGGLLSVSFQNFIGDYVVKVSKLTDCVHLRPWIRISGSMQI